MTAIQFKALQVHDDRPAIAREMSLNRVCSFAGIHDLDMSSAIFENYTTGTISDYNMGDETGTWAITAGALEGTGGGVGSTWYKVLHDTSVELGWVAQFDKHDIRGAFLFCCDASWNGYQIYWDGTDVCLHSLTADAYTVLSKINCTETGNATITVAVRPVRYTDVDEIDDLVITMWYDSRHILTHLVGYDSTKGDRVGFAVYESDVCTFDNLWVPQLHQWVEWTSVDPGEYAGSSLNRVISQANIKMRSRYDGSVKFWKPGDPASSWTIPSGRYRTKTNQRAIYMPTHIRLVGAKHEAENFREGTQGHIFEIADDPNVLSHDAVADQASVRHKEIEEAGNTYVISGPPNPLIEPEDVVTLDGTDRKVDTISWDIAWKGARDEGAPVLDSQMRLRDDL